MKLKNLLTAALSIAVVFTGAKYLTFSNQQNQVKELLQTKQCPECNFSNANLKGLDLQGVNLTGADLGCAGITFNFEANEKEANMDFNVTAVPEQNNPENAVGDLRKNKVPIKW